MTQEVQAFISGAMLGGLYAIMAMGLSVTWGLLKLINLAHFGLILLSAYVTFEFTSSTGLDPLLALVITVPSFFVLGVVTHWAFERFRVSEFKSLLVSFGLLLIVVQVITNIWSADFQRLPAAENRYGAESLLIAGIALPVPRILNFGVALAVAAIAWYVLTSTYVGKALRAVGQDRDMAAAFGVDYRRVAVVAAGLAASTAALAGCLVSIGGGMFPGLAYEWFGIVFTVVILGGIGNLLGCVWAGLLVGGVAGLAATVWQPSYALLATFLVLVLALLFRPYGLLGRSRAS
jgi:branched-chain amino acid transport system permease protein